MSLRTDYTDDVLDTSQNTKRKYQLIRNSDGTYSLTDVTVYTSEGDYFGAADINATNSAVNTVLADWSLGEYINMTTVFNQDGSITETNTDTGYKDVTTFNNDGSITKRKYDENNDLIATMNTVFNVDGTVNQTVTLND